MVYCVSNAVPYLLSMQKEHLLSFDNTEVAFRHASNADLRRAYWLFKLINSNFLVQIGPPITNLALKMGLPIQGLIKKTIFKQFCGGEDIRECENTIKTLAKGGVGTILDYSVEGEDSEQVFDETRDEILKTIRRAAKDPSIPLTVFKVTGVGRFALLQKMDERMLLTDAETEEWQRAADRVLAICEKAYEAGIPVMIDAEESWIQDTIDLLALNMMRRFNKEKAIVYNTYQLYRADKLASLKQDSETARREGFVLGAKLVRGAYMEKERSRAEELGYPSPIQIDKVATDWDFNLALDFCVENIDHLAFVAGTHNEASCLYLTELIKRKQITDNKKHIYFAQLLGMSDNLSFNLADAGYHVAKYVPYGPIKAVMPYLFRRAQENTAIAGQMSRELSLIVKEMKRRGI